jgi:LAS superfamily LD-carboxypeptidase LdcB
MRKNSWNSSFLHIVFFAILLTVLNLLSCNQPPKNNSEPQKTTVISPQSTNHIIKPETKELQMFTMPDKSTVIGKPEKKNKDSLLVAIPLHLASRTGMLIHYETLDAFKKMHEAATNNGIELKIISAYRDFFHQKRIWENKWNGVQILSGNINATTISDPIERATEILKFSAMPGTSRHHWGTDIDINSLNNSYFENGKGKAEYDWLKENAHKFGFCQPYTPRAERENIGYEEEKWHWSYIPVASDYLKVFTDSITYDDLRGFDGWETAQKLDAINNYVLGIDQDCLKLNKKRSF